MCSVLEQQCGLSVLLWIWSPEETGISGGELLVCSPCSASYSGVSSPHHVAKQGIYIFGKVCTQCAEFGRLHLIGPHPTLLDMHFALL